MIIGENGQLGSDLSYTFSKDGHQVIGLNHNQLEISNIDSVKKNINDSKPDLIVNTAAFHNVEACEELPNDAFEVNSLGAKNLAIVANELNCTLMHISTDYVFDGSRKTPYIETDNPLPLNVYGITKLAGEHFIRSIASKYYIVRLSGLYGNHPCRAKDGLNFVNLMLKLSKERDEIRVVNDEVLTPTFTQDISKQILKLSLTDSYGLFHLTAQGSCSWYEFAEFIFKLSDVRVNLQIANSNEFPTKAPRPKYSVLDNKALRDLSLDIMPSWREGLKRYLSLL